MGEFEKDFVMRQIRQLVRFIAQVVLRARTEERDASGIAEVRTAVEKWSGLSLDVLDRLEPASVAQLVREGEVLRTLAWVVAQEGEIHEAAGDAGAARQRRGRAIALYAECAERFPAEEAACREAARVLAEGTALESLADRHRRWLEPGTPGAGAGTG
jgi:hypothetical protein